MKRTRVCSLAERICLLALAIVVGACAARGQAAPTGSPAHDPASARVLEHELAEARTLYNHAEYNSAWKLYCHILVLDPGNEPARRGRKLAYDRRPENDLVPKDPLTSGVDYPANPITTPSPRPDLKPKDFTPDFIAVRKVCTIILPKVSFREVPLEDAVGFLRGEALRLDPVKERRKKGVLISLSAPADAPAYVPRDPPAVDAAISLELGRVTLGDALEFVAHQADRRVSFVSGRIWLTADWTVDDNGMHWKPFRTWPEMFAVLSHDLGPVPKFFTSPGPIEIPQVSAAPFLASRGVSFPPGAKAVFYGGNQVLVCNTPENLDKMEALVDQSPEEIAPVPTPATP